MIYKSLKIKKNKFFNERIIKAQGNVSNVYENGQLTHTNVSFDNFVMYPSAFFVVDLMEDTYSKHYYAGGQRIAARMEQNNALFRENNDTSEDPKLSAAKTNAIEEDFKRYFKDKNVNISFDTQSYREGDIRAMSSSIEELYFYHPDHLGTATFLTDIVGNPYQFFLNLPFGESMAEQRSYTGGFDNRWLFTGKELDESTGLYYFGARFYNPSTSIWLSVDPLVEQTFDAYGYCYQNPINLIDPTGMSAEEMEDDNWIKNLETNEVKWFDGNRTESEQKAREYWRKSFNKTPEIEVLGDSFFGSVQGTIFDYSQIKKQREEYLLESAKRIVDMVGITERPGIYGNATAAGVTYEYLSSIFLGTQFGGQPNSNSNSELVGWAWTFGSELDFKKQVGSKLPKITLSTVFKSAITNYFDSQTAHAPTMRDWDRAQAVQKFGTHILPVIDFKMLMEIQFRKF